MHAAPIPVVHAITSEASLAAPAVLERAHEVMRALGARGAVHVRSRVLAARQLHALAAALAPLQERTGCWLVVNDRVDIARAVGAAGVQLRERSLPLADARAIAPGLAPGVSVHAPPHAAAAARDGAAWVLAGHVFETATHAGVPGRGLPFLRAVCTAAGATPCIAVGGIHPEHVPALRAAGAHGVAAIRGIWHVGDAGRAAREYLFAYDGDPRP